MTAPRLAIVYDRGAADVRDIVPAMDSAYDLVFVVPVGDAEVITSLAATAPVYAMDDHPDHAALVAALTADRPLDGIVTYSERMLRHTAALAELLGLTGHSPATAHALTDKAEQRRRLAAAGLPTPRHARAADAAGLRDAVAEVSLPAIVKPVRGEGSRHTYRMRSAVEVDTVAAMLFGPAAEPMADGYTVESLYLGRSCAPFGDYVSVECMTVRGVSQLIAVTGKFPLVDPFREPGQFWPAPLDDDEYNQCVEITIRALAALGVRDSLSHTELKLTAAGPRIIEVNGRLGGFIADLAIRHAGLDLVRLAADIAVGADVPDAQIPVGSTVTYNFSNLAPADAARVVTMPSARGLKGRQGFVSYRRFYQDGQPLPSDGRTDELDMVRGHAGSYPEMFANLRGQLADLVFTFEPNGAVLALDLPSGPVIAGV
jgi:biotin carboxylase